MIQPIFLDSNLTEYIKQDKLAYSERFSPSPLIGYKFGDYRIEKLLGEGSFGIVYLLSENNNKNNLFALKILKLWDIDPEERETSKTRFLMETHHAKINSQYLVTSITRGLIGNNPFFIMKYCSNGDLRSRLNADWDEKSIRKLSIEVLSGLKALHDRKIVHRDLKPENVLFDDNNQSCLTDFSISGNLNLNVRITSYEKEGDRKIFGTYAYIAPEYFSTTKPMELLSPSNDIFSFGVLLYEVVTKGKLPFGDPVKDFGSYFAKLLKGELNEFTSEYKDGNRFWFKLIQGCLQPDPNKRYKKVDELLMKLKIGK